MAEAKKAIENYLRDIERTLKQAGETPERIADIKKGLREHIEDVASDDGADIESVLAQLDPPLAFVEDTTNAAPKGRDYFGLAGFVLGLACFVSGFIIIPNAAPGLLETVAKPMIVFGMILSISLGIVGRASKFGLASIALAVSILTLIIVTGVLGN